MSRDKLIEKKKGDIKGALNLALIMIDGETDPENILGRLSATIEMLKKEAKAMACIDDYLELRELFED